MMKYRVQYYQDGIYEVMEKGEREYSDEESVFQGSLSDCEAFIRLHENGYM